MVCHRREAKAMRKILKDFYYGNIIPCEQQLTERSDEADRFLLAGLVNAQHDIVSITAQENFILGFWLGVRMMTECIDEDDGNIQKVEDSG